MNTAVERIRAKITELETKIGDLRIAEKELLALGFGREVREKAERRPKPMREKKPKTRRVAGFGKTIGGAIVDVLSAQGGLLASDIAERVQAEGRAIDNRQVSFALQVLKKQGAVKGAKGKWSLTKPGKARAEAGKEQPTETLEDA